MADTAPTAPLEDLGADLDAHSDPVEDEVLVEEISIDGMCGVY